MRDASLDDFLDGPTKRDDGEEPDGEEVVADGAAATDADTDAGGGSTGSCGDPADADEAAVAADPGDVEPAASTYAWSDEAVACEACGERAERRWRDGDRLVCAGCKEW